MNLTVIVIFCTGSCWDVTFPLCCQLYLHVLQSVFLHLQSEVGLRQAKRCYNYASLPISRQSLAKMALECGETLMGLVETN